MIKNLNVVEKNIVNVGRVSCDGGQVYGHPKVYLEIGKEKSVKCLYCGRLFVYKAKEILNNKVKNI